MNLDTHSLRAALEAFRPLDTAAYLRTHGWQQVEAEPGKLAIWKKAHNGSGDFEVLLPLAEGFRDYRLRVAELLETLVIEEQRPLTEIIEDLSTPNADIQRIRLPIEGGWEGTLPLEAGSNVFQSIRDLVLAGASAAIQPRKAYGPRRAEQALEFLRRARIGRNKPGSFVVSVISPVPPVVACDDEQGLEEQFADEPFARRAMRTLALALESAASGITETAITGSISPMLDRVSAGVSANLCDALASLQEVGGDKDLEFTFSWAPTRRPPMAPTSVRIAAGAKSLFEQVAIEFRRTAVLEDVQVAGFVQKLRRLSESTGEATIVGIADGVSRSLVIELSGSAHNEAVRAYDKRLEVACEGELVRDGKQYRLLNPRGFRVSAQAAE